MRTGVLRNEDQKSAVRSLREYLDTIKQNKLRTDSTSDGGVREKDPAKANPVSLSTAVAPSLSTITESTVAPPIGDDEVLAPPRVQRTISEDAPASTNVFVAVEGGDVGVAEDGVGGTGTTNATAKAQDVVGGVWPNGTAEKGVATHPAPAQHEPPSSTQVTKRTDTVPVVNPAHSANRATPDTPPLSAHQQLTSLSQSNVGAPDHPIVSAQPEEERKHVRTNSNESEKRQQGPAPSDEKPVGVAEGAVHTPKFVVEPVSAIAMATETGTGRFEEGAAVTPIHVPTTSAVLQPPDISSVQSEHSAESTPSHFSQASLESTSATTISTQEQVVNQDARDKSTGEKLAVEKGGNGTLKKKGARGKTKQIKLNFVEMTDEKVVKCALVTVTGQMVNFQFSMKYDKPVVMFQKLVR